VNRSSGMAKRKRGLPSITISEPPRAESSTGSPPDEFSVAAYQESRSWVTTTAAALSPAPGPGVWVSLRTRPPRQGTLPLIQHRPSIEAYWQARFGHTPFSREQHAEIVRVTEFGYAELLKPYVQFAPLYADLSSNSRQRMIIRTWFRESLSAFVWQGLGPGDVLGPMATCALAWTLTFSAGVVLEIPPSRRQFIDFQGLLSYFNGLVHDGNGADISRIWHEMVGLVIVLEATMAMKGLFYPTRPRKSSGGGSSN
jgi:hypothetical protein